MWPFPTNYLHNGVMDCPAVRKDNLMCPFYKLIWVFEVVKLCEEVQKEAMEGILDGYVGVSCVIP